MKKKILGADLSVLAGLGLFLVVTPTPASAAPQNVSAARKVFTLANATSIWEQVQKKKQADLMRIVTKRK
jgi:hypothetical protein